MSGLWSGVAGFWSGVSLLSASFSGFSGGGGLSPAGGGSEPDFSLSENTVTTEWGPIVVGNLIPLNAPAGVSFVLVNEDAGFAVVNGGAE